VNVALRPFERHDITWLDSWLTPVAASVGYEGVSAAAAGASLLARAAKERNLRAPIIERDGKPVGLLVYRLHAPRRRAAIIELVATPPAEARRGAGMRSAVLVEEQLRSEGVTAVYAPAPAVHGIAMYFWIRLGYRPLMRADWPCERNGVAWLRRDIASPQPYA
jgi:hypothetical protein